jgi:uncharacterized protein YjiS (DUF1127 family)
MDIEIRLAISKVIDKLYQLARALENLDKLLETKDEDLGLSQSEIEAIDEHLS